MKTSFLGKIKSVLTGGESTEVVEKPRASEYVDWLPGYMLKTSKRELRISTETPLPGAYEADEEVAPPVLPDAAEVINRLKVMCELNPFPLPQPTTAEYERELLNHQVRFALRFADASEESSCDIRIASVSSLDG